MSITGNKAIAAASVSTSDAIGEALGSGSPKSTRWENVVGKALKDLATAVMQRDGVNRDQARLTILLSIQQATRVIGGLNGRETQGTDSVAV